MYSQIQQEKNQGFTRESVARHLKLTWRTVDGYWDMTAEGYEEAKDKQCYSLLKTHEPAVLGWLEQFPDLSAAQVQDWIQEHYGERYPDRSVRRYVFNLREKHALTKDTKRERIWL